MRVCVIGVGNLLNGDDGVGVALATRLQRHLEGRPQITVLDGGVSGIDLLFPLQEADLGLLIDAAFFDGAVGELRIVPAAHITAQASHNVTLHGVGLPEVLALLRTTGAHTAVYLALIQVVSTLPGTTLSPQVADRLDEIASELLQFIDDHTNAADVIPQ